MDDDAAELIRRRRDELLSELAVLSEALRRLMEVEEEAEQYEQHAARWSTADAMAAAGTHTLLHRSSDDPVAAVMAAADDHRGITPDDDDLSWLDATSEPGDEDATQLAGYQENDDDDDDDDIWGPIHQAIATGRLYVPRIQSSTSASLDSDLAYAYHHHIGGGAPALASDDDDDSPYLFAAAAAPASSDEPEHPMRHLEHRMHEHDQDYYSFRAFGLELTPFRSSDDGGFGGLPASATAIAALRKQRYDGTGTGSGCVICFRAFKQGRRLAVMPCAYGHRFHRKCLRKWLKSSHVCPLCRYALPTQ